MNLLKRIKNLWKLSEWSPDEIRGSKMPSTKVLTGLIKNETHLAQIIKKENVIDKFLKNGK